MTPAEKRKAILAMRRAYKQLGKIENAVSNAKSALAFALLVIHESGKGVK